MLGPAAFSQRDRMARPRPLLRHMVGHVLRRTRLEQGRTLSDVARTARVSMPYLSELERGRKEASSEVLAAICDALRIDLSDLLAQVGSDLAGDPTRTASGLSVRAGNGRSTESSQPEDPRALAGTAHVHPDGLPGASVGQPAEPAELAVDVVRLLGDPGDGLANNPRGSMAHLRSPADVHCLLAA